jgi:hypothetical protein
MADWYVSSAVYATLPVWQPSTVYNVGDIVRPTAPAAGVEHAFRVTTAGTSGTTEPPWSSSNNGTSVIAGARFTNVTGQAAYGWSAPAGSLLAISSSLNRPVVGDRVFLSSDHSEDFTPTNLIYSFNNNTQAFGLVQIISVNRAGSVPPVPVDIQSGAAITAEGVLILDGYTSTFWQGITFTAGATSGQGFNFASNGDKGHYFKNCAFNLVSSSTSGRYGTSIGTRVVFDNTTLLFATSGHSIGGNGPCEWVWINTPSAIQGINPAALFTPGPALGSGHNSITCRGVDLSAITGTLVSIGTTNSNVMVKALFESCKIAPGATRMAAAAAGSNTGDEVELINCWDGTNTLNERYIAIGNVVTDRSTYMTTGAQDDIGHYALKLTTNVGPDKFTMPLPTFAFDVDNTSIGASKTATVEMIAPMPLNNDDISLLLEYLGTSGSSVASFASSLPTVPPTPSALSTSTGSWSASPAYSWSPTDIFNTSLGGTNNLTASGVGSSIGGVRATGALNSGKWYWEYKMTTWTSISTICGIATGLANLSSVANDGQESAVLFHGGFATVNGAGTSVSLGTRASGDVIGVAVDVPNGLIWWRVAPSGNWNGSSTANPATGAGGVPFASGPNALIAPSQTLPLYCPGTGGEQCTANFGGSSFTGAVPAGFTSGIRSAGPTKLQVTFTPRVAGRVRGVVRLGHVLTTAWVDPRITIA